jgi:PadR family transcriptional regulator, regulatory protein AphA
MSLRFALLGFLTTEPASGYRLAQEFSESMGWFWQASHSQIHPELKRLEAEGLVRSEHSNEDGRGTRIYSITARGRAELDAWLAEDTEYPPLRDAERIKLVFLDQHPPEVIRKHLEAHRAHHQALLDTYSAQLRAIHAGTFGRLRKRLASQPAATHELVSGLKVLALQGNVMRARNEVAWAGDALLWLDGITGAGPGPGSGSGSGDTS